MGQLPQHGSQGWYPRVVNGWWPGEFFCFPPPPPPARIGEVESDVFDLFVQLDATEEQLDFPVVYASAKDGWTAADAFGPRSDMTHLLNVILDKVLCDR